MNHSPTLIGTVQDVSGTTVSVSLTSDTITGVCFISGECYRIGQIGSFVKIPLGSISLYGIVSQVGAGAAPESEQSINPFGNRWIQIQLVGEGALSKHFERGISQYPTIDDEVHIVTEEDLKAIYGPGDPTDYVAIGHLASSESIPTYVDINKLVTRHSAILGTTGCGKSTTVAGLLNTLSNEDQYPSARIFVIDIHGEYATALKEKCKVLRVGAKEEKGEKELYVPFWALSFDELTKFLFGSLSNDGKAYAAIADEVIKLKKESLREAPIEGVTQDLITVDLPVPFCLHKLWYDLYTQDFMTIRPKQGVSKEEMEIAYAKDSDGNELKGDPMNGIPPEFLSIKTTGSKEEKIEWGKSPIGMRQQLASLGTKLRDPRYNFICNPGPYRPDLKGKAQKGLADILKEWIGNEKPVTILDLSGIPSTILTDIIGAVLRVIYDALFWGRNLPEGARERPLLLILEEAHAYLNKESNGSAATSVKRIAKEGRKYGVGMMVVSQRPSEVDSTILSQCGTIIAMRLSNSVDRGQVTSAAQENLHGLFDTLPILRTGEAIIVGEAVSLPVRTLITPPPMESRPDSFDPKVVARGNAETGFDSPGAWNQKKEKEDYKFMVHQWRTQTSKIDSNIHKQIMEEHNGRMD